MKNTFRSVAFSALLALGAFSAVTYTACTKDECKDVTCANGGTCSGGNCSCPVGYEGTTCQTLSRDKFIGTYIGNETCTTGTDNYTITIATNSDVMKLTISNIYNNAAPVYTATATVTGANGFTFSNTQAGATFSGTGTLSGNQITISYTVSDALTSNSCTYIGTK